MRVLFAEDQDDFRKTWAPILRAWGYEVEECRSQSQAEQLIAQCGDEFDIALLDMRMEHDDSGLQIIRLLAEKCPDVPAVVVLTAYGELDNARRCMEAGAFSYVPKERATEVLQSTMESAIARAGERRRLLVRLREQERRGKLSVADSGWQETISECRAEVCTSSAAQGGDLVKFLADFYREKLLARSNVEEPDEPVGPAIRLALQGTSADRAEVQVLVDGLEQPDAQAPVPPKGFHLPRILHRLLQRFLAASEISVACFREGTRGVIEFRVQGLSLTADRVERIRALLAGAEPTTLEEGLLTRIALRASQSGAWLTVEGAEEDVRIRLLISTA